MSDALYAIRLYWDGRRGCAKHGVRRELQAMPPILPITVIQIDYAPEVNVAQVMEPGQPWRDMTTDERALVRAWLEQERA